MKIGDPRYQPTGMATARAPAARTPVRAGCRRAAANQPSRHATPGDDDDRDDRDDGDQDALLVQRAGDVVGQVTDGHDRQDGAGP